MFDEELVYRIAITQVEGIGDHLARKLLLEMGSAKSVFHAPKRQLEKFEGIGQIRAKAILNFKHFKRCEEEIRFLHRHKIQAIYFQDPDYPVQLSQCYDAPILLYFRGSIHFPPKQIISIVGTRSPSAYGINWTRELLHDLNGSNILIVSGLAQGIDTIAHEAALENNLPSLGILAHGLDTLYPAGNRQLAKRMLQHGGLMTHFISGTKAERMHFPSRNRITAGICDALIVVESDIRGGSLITSGLAYGYQKEIFALPGRVNDNTSAGCNWLIKQQQALPIHNASDLLTNLNWCETGINPKSQPPPKLFYQPSSTEKEWLEFMQELVHVDEIGRFFGLNPAQLSAWLFEMEMAGVVLSKPGKRYQMNPDVKLA
jgi:DNA processing protein